MSEAQARANQQLHFASLLGQVLERELERGEFPAAALQQALGEGAQRCLRGAYGWYLLALAGMDELPLQPPGCAAEAEAWAARASGGKGPLRGELVELAALEQGPGWLRDLLEDNCPPCPAQPAPTRLAQSAPTRLALPRPAGREAAASPISLREEGPWTAQRLQGWQSELTTLMDRMNDSLEEC